MSKKKFNPEIAAIARKKIGQFLRTRRLELGWTQAELGERAGLRQATITDIEMGRPCELDTILAILGCMRGELQIIWHDINSIAGFPMDDNLN